MKNNIIKLNEASLNKIVSESIKNALEEGFGDNLRDRWQGMKTGAKLGKSGIEMNRSFTQKNIDPHTNKFTDDYLSKGINPNSQKYKVEGPRNQNYPNRNFFYMAGLAGVDRNNVVQLANALGCIGYNKSQEFVDFYDKGAKMVQGNLQEANGTFDKIGGAIRGFTHPYRMNQDLRNANYARSEAEKFQKARKIVQGGGGVYFYMGLIDDIANGIKRKLPSIQREMGTHFTAQIINEMAQALKNIFNQAGLDYDRYNTSHDNVKNVTATLSESVNEAAQDCTESKTNKKMKQNTIKLNEGQLRKIVAESVKKMLKEYHPDKVVRDTQIELFRKKQVEQDEMEISNCMSELKPIFDSIEDKYGDLAYTAIMRLAKEMNPYPEY